MIKIETSTENRNKLHAIPPFPAGIICFPHRGSFSVRGHLRSKLGIICGAVWRREMFGSSGQFLEGHEKFSHPESRIKISNLFYLLRVSNLMITGLFLFTFFTKTVVMNHFIQEVSDVYSSVFLYTDKLKNGGHKFLGSDTKSWASTSAEGGWVDWNWPMNSVCTFH